MIRGKWVGLSLIPERISHLLFDKAYVLKRAQVWTCLERESVKGGLGGEKE